MAIARAVLEFVTDKRLAAKTMFATHYHELTDAEGLLPGVKNYNTAVKKRGEDITFLRRIVRGPADGSYGIDVARLAGIPDKVVSRAREILIELESGQEQPRTVPYQTVTDSQMSLTSGAAEQLVDEIKNMDINVLTPIEAMSRLAELIDRARKI
jgi:DNA mismatch repair protein MutS